MEFGLTSVVAITIVCYLLGQGIKASPVPSKWLPVLCGICGGLLGILGFFIMKAYPAEDMLTAAAVGIESGLAATGAHEVKCQLQKKNEKSNESEEGEP